MILLFTSDVRFVHNINPNDSFDQVKLLGEGADDAGGVFDAIVTEMCDELLNGSVPLLIPTPNNLNDVGYNRDRFLLNPRLTSEEDLILFRFLGKNHFLPSNRKNKKLIR